jgi:hypothetical protein
MCACQRQLVLSGSVFRMAVTCTDRLPARGYKIENKTVFFALE